MGSQESRPVAYGSTPNLSTGSGSLRRSSLYKSITLDQTQAKHELLKGIQYDIDAFSGSKSDNRYKELKQTLVNISVDLEQIKRKSNKERTREQCDLVLRDVQISLQRLEAKAASNEYSESGLDLAAVESDSFINETFHKPVQSTPQYKPELVKSLNDVEHQLQNLEREVKVAIEYEDTKYFTVLEKKITILYGDLVMVQVEENTPLSERREGFERRLIICNNQIKKCKRRVTKRLSEQPQRISTKPDSEDEIDKTQQRLSEIEMEALTFEGVKTDKRYKELEQILERYWTKLYSTDLFTDEERQRRDLTVEKTKEVLQELRKRADENEKHTKAFQSLMRIEQQLEELNRDVSAFSGSSSDAEYTRLDQDARRLWASLNEIEDVSENIKSNKASAIANIKTTLKLLSQNTKKRESQLLEEIYENQLLKQVEEFHNHWNQLSQKLNEKSFLQSSISISIIEILETVLEGLRRKTRELKVVENRKSNASLVIAKVTDSSDLNIKYTSAPDLVPLRLGIPESDLNTTPLNKTEALGEIHRIGNDAKILLQQIKQVIGIKNEDKESFENKLDECKSNLNAVEYNKKSDTIENNKRHVYKIIQDGYKALDEKVTSEKTRSSNALEMLEVDAEIQYWRQQIRNFTGTFKDKQYEKIKIGLSESLIKLQVLGDRQVSKQESIQQIQQHHQELETKLAENQAKVKCAEIKRQTSQDIKATVEQVKKLKAQVDRFIGIHNGLLYKQIEGNLRVCFNKLDTFDTKTDERLNNAKEQTKQKIQKYLTILEEKSVKADKPQDTVNSVQNVQKPQDSQILRESSSYQRVYSEDLSKDRQQQPEAAITTTEISPKAPENFVKQEQPQTAALETHNSAKDVSTEKQQQPQITSADTELPHHKINAIREKLVVAKENVETFSGRYKDAQFFNIQNELQDFLQKLKCINDGGHASVAASKAQYIDYVEQLLHYFEDKTLAAESGEFREADEV